MRKILVLILLGGLFMAQVSLAKITPKVETLENGLEVWVFERHVLPFAVFKLLVPAGSVFDPESKAGLAYLTSQMLTEGAGNYTAEEFSERLDFIGADLSVDCTKDYTSITLKVTRRHMKEGLGLLADLLLRPTFPAKEFVRVKNEVVGEILKDQEDPGIVASNQFNELVYGKDHPYHRPVKGYIETVRGISLDEVKEFYKAHYLPEGSRLVVVGDVDRTKLMDELNALFKGWVGRAPSYPREPEVGYRPQKKVVPKDVTQANIVIGHLGVKRSNPDFIPLYVANQILGGGGLTSRLFERIREKGGLSYSVYSMFVPTLYTGTFRVVLQTKNDSADVAIRDVLDVVREYVDKGPTPQELEDAKRYLTGSFPLKIDTNGEIADYLAFAAFYGLGRDYLNRFSEMVNAVSLEDVRRVIKKYIHPDKFTIVVVRREAQSSR